MILIEDPKMLESMEKKMSEVLKMNTYWKDRADDYESKYKDAQRRAGYFEGAYEEFRKKNPTTYVPPAQDGFTAGDCVFCWCMIGVGAVLGCLITIVVNR